MNEHTEKLLPISVLHQILFDEDVFLDFYNKKDAFENIDVKNDIKNLNDYMRLLIKTSKKLDDDVYERMNAINKLYDYNSMLYKKDIYCTDKLITTDAIENILSNEDTFNKFMHYEEFKHEFNAGGLLEYLIEIVEYYNYVIKTELILDYDMARRYRDIIRKYSLDLKRYHKVVGNAPNGIINPEMENDILRSIDTSQSKFNIAYKVYRELNKRCRYNPNYIALDARGGRDAVLDIYNENIANIDKNNNEVVCSSWASMYAYLLQKLGFVAKVSGNYHKYVEFDCDGTLMRADATDVKEAGKDGFYLNDITRCQLGLQVENFVCLEEVKDLTDIMENAYLESNDNKSDKLVELKRMEQFYKEEYMGNKTHTPIDVKIKLIKDKCLECGLVDAELAKYVDLLMKISFSYEELKDMDVNYVCIRVNGIFHMSVMFRLDNSYYIFDNECGLIRKDENEIIELFNCDDLVLVGKNARCRLLDEIEENAYARVG